MSPARVMVRAVVVRTSVDDCGLDARIAWRVVSGGGLHCGLGGDLGGDLGEFRAESP